MTTEYTLQMALDIRGEPEFVIAEKKYTSLKHLIFDLSDAVRTFAGPDLEPRVLTFILASRLK